MDFNFKIDRKSGLPIYIQLKNSIMEDVKNGKLRIGTQMPTERELAARLNTSRNTVSSAYNLLEQDGVLVSYQGKGTFVAEEARTWKQHNFKDKLLRIIDLGLEEALEMGLNTQEYLAIICERIREKEDLFKKINAVFIECNIEQSREFAKQLSNEINLNVTPIVLSSLENRDEELTKTIEEAQLIIATFNHVNDVKNFTSDLNKDVFGIAITPSLETIVKIARYPKETRFGFFCISKEFQFKVENALKSAGLDNLNIQATVSRNPDDIREIVEKTDVIIVSPGRRDDVGKIVNNNKEIISFDYNLDEDSVKALISKTVEIKKER